MKKEFMTPIIRIVVLETDDIVTESSSFPLDPTETRDDMGGGWSPWH